MYKDPLKYPMKIGIMSKMIKQSGNMAWEYNPLRNYRLSGAKYFFRNRYFSKEELEKELGETIGNAKDWSSFREKGKIKSDEEDPILYDKNELVDLDTDELNFDINHPVDVLPQYSYDGSVNLILNDGKNKPRLINSRFSVIGRNKYNIVDRKGNNDTNIYDQGSQFNTDTSLYKTYIGIPKLEFYNVSEGGNVGVGNYHFYFKYVDADGNETDFVAESGLVSIFKGTGSRTVRSGFRNENAYKTIHFKLSNIDPAYQKVHIYYTVNTADIYQNPSTNAFRIDQDFLVDLNSVCKINITGIEPKTEVPIDEINRFYQIANGVQTQATCQNMLFLGNFHGRDIHYKELSDLSLRFTLHADTTLKYTNMDSDYYNSAKGTYRDPLFIYESTGYQNKEIYRFGIVYLMDDGTLSPVFNMRGMYFNGDSDIKYTKYPLYNEEKKELIYGETVTTKQRNYISFNEDNGIVYKNKGESSEFLENVYGIIRIKTKVEDETSRVIGIKVKIDEEEEGLLLNELKKHKIKGYFFVRQKRMPLRICQAYSIGIDSESNTPLLYADKNVHINRTINGKNKRTLENDSYITERFIDDDKNLNHIFENHIYNIDKSKVHKFGAICPDYDIDNARLNTLFSGNEYYVEPITNSIAAKQNSLEERHFFVENKNFISDPVSTSATIIGVEDNVKLVEVDRDLFSARAGEAEYAYRYSYINEKIKHSDSINLLRGSYGPYLGIHGFEGHGVLFNIYIKDYKDMSAIDLFKLRISDKSPFFAISDRFDIDDEFGEKVLYRGDTFICTFTHRINRNFQDPSTPINDVIIDNNAWSNNYEVNNNTVNIEKFENINLGDVNAVKLGMWITFNLISNHNLNIRAVDESNVDEMSLTGHARSFYPYSSISADGSTKIKEALCFNSALDKTLSERYNFETPDVPAIKNDYTNRIAYSDIYINDAFKNGFRTFQGNHYRDYPKTYGQITSLTEMGGNLLCVFEHGIAVIPVNERAVAGEGAGGNVYINTSNVLPENPKIVSDTFGSQWKESIVKTDVAIYGVDTIAKVIWAYDGQSLAVISEMTIQEFLNYNISLSERELTPIIGIRNVKTHYYKNKGDVIFTFYDNLYDFEEKVWSITYNELLKKWVTFNSWIPSYSANIDNIFFSFDRDTSMGIAKLGVSRSGNEFSDGVCLSENIIPNDAKKGHKVGYLSLENRNLPTGDNVTHKISYSLERDPFNQYKNFSIQKDSDGYYLRLETDAVNLCSEMYKRGTRKKNKYTNVISSIDTESKRKKWIENCVLNSNYTVVKDDYGKREFLDEPYRDDYIVPLLWIKANIGYEKSNIDTSLTEAYQNSFSRKSITDAGYYKSMVAVCPKYNLQFLTNDFWKHGNAGIFDITEDVQPTLFYGRQHPFEFEFVLNDNISMQKMLDNLSIVSNNVPPESFHYEVVADDMDFAKDKKNMYIRQEATKELFQNNGSNISFDHEYKKLREEQRLSKGGFYEKSILFPLYYFRRDKINRIEDYYHMKDGGNTKDYSKLSGSEIVHYNKLKEFRVVSHSEANDIQEVGRLRGNMSYLKDVWEVQVNPITFAEKNESAWENGAIPIIIDESLIPDEVYQESLKDDGNITLPDDRTTSVWNYTENQMKETKVRGKWVKIRVRYTGDKLSIISAINTSYTYSIS